MSNQSKASPLYILEGNIGAGKSTLLALLNNYLDVDIIPEPTNKWQKIGSDNLLDLFYKDTKRWAYTFQSYAFISRIQTFLEHQAQQTHPQRQILERSVYCDRYCFAKNCFETGTMSDLEWQIYTDWFSWLVTNYTQPPSGFIYIRTNPEVCYELLIKRNRSEEATIPLSYLSLLHTKHEEWLIDKKDVSTQISTIPVLILDCDEEFEENKAQHKKIMEQIRSFMQKCDGRDDQLMLNTLDEQLSSSQQQQ